MARKGQRSGGKAHRFGGDWTTSKLTVLGKYLAAYSTALKNSRFKTAYIDAFAGTGYRALKSDESGHLLFPDLADRETQGLLDGSARVALKTEPPFHKYIFIERSAERCRELEALKGEFPLLAPSIDVRQGDANEKIRDLCSKDRAGKQAIDANP